MADDVGEEFVGFAEEVDAFAVLWEGEPFGDDFAEGIFPGGDAFDFDDFGVGDEIDAASGCVDFHLAAEFGMKATLDIKFGALSGLELDFVGALAPLGDFGQPAHEGGAVEVEFGADLVDFGGLVKEALEFEVEKDAVSGGAEVAVFEDVEDGFRIGGNRDRAFRMVFGEVAIDDFLGEFDFGLYGWFPACDVLNPALYPHYGEFLKGVLRFGCPIARFKSVVSNNYSADFSTDNFCTFLSF